MSKKDYESGMKAAGMAYKDKCNELKKENRKIAEDIKNNIQDITDCQDDLIDIVEEHEIYLEKIQGYQAMTEDKERLLKLDSEMYKLLVGLLSTLKQEDTFNDSQDRFFGNLLGYLEIEETAALSFESLIDVDNINTQRIFFRVICEVLFLKSNSIDHIENYKEYLDNFSVSINVRKAILGEIQNVYDMLGADAIINKYSIASRIYIEKNKKIYPRLEVDLGCHVYIDYPYISLDDDDEFLFGDVEYVCRSESKCQRRVKEVIEKYYDRANSYLDIYSDKFIGIKLAKECSKWINQIIAQIENYISVNKLRIRLDDLKNIRENSESNILQICINEMDNNLSIYSLHDLSFYIDRVEIEENEDYIETLFGGFREVKTYDADCIDTVFKIDTDLNEIIRKYEEYIISNVKIEYFRRIKNVCDELQKSFHMEGDEKPIIDLKEALYNN